jgi:hypothetical protein
MALIGLIFTGAGILPLKNYFIQGFWQNVSAWSVLIFFLILPVIGLLTWLIRRIIGVRSNSNYLGYIFGSLWVIGLISLIFLAASFSRHFSTASSVNDEIELTPPTNGKLTVKMDDSKPYYIDESDWMGMDWRHKGPFFNLTDDSLTLNTVRVDIVKSRDSAWHLQRVRRSLGNTTGEARGLAAQIFFPVEQKDSVLILSRGFTITPKQQFRNQKVLLVIEMPVGKKILMKRNLDDYKWFNINSRRWRNNGVNIEWNDSDNDFNSWDADVEYTMTENGLERTGKNSRGNTESDEDQNGKSAPDSNQKKKDNPNGDYRYRKPKTANAEKAQDTSEKIQNKDREPNAVLVLLTNLS